MNNYFLIITLFFSFCGDPTTLADPPIPVDDMQQILKKRQWFVASNNYSLVQTDTLHENTDSVLSGFQQIIRLH